MIIKGLELNNFRKHRKLKLKFEQGVTGIVGDNDCGKTTVLESILFALTGLLFSGNREDAISLGEDSGDVTLRFVLNGKQGYIQRWLSGSKVHLAYDGKMALKKSGEVKELWDSLLQVGPEIISKVIIAQQGDIPLLFSGDSSIREKIFQKIFMVPNTEKIRSTISKNYLKQLPPLLPIEDKLDLEAEMARLTKEIEELKYSLLDLTLLSDEDVETFRDQIKFLNKCEADIGSRIIVKEAIVGVEAKLVELAEELKTVKELLGSINIKDYEKQRNTLIQHKALYEQKIKLKHKLDNLTSTPVDMDAMVKTGDLINELSKKETSLYARSIELKVKIDANTIQINKFKDLKDKPLCHTCGQPLHSITELVKMLEDDKNDWAEEYVTVMDDLRRVRIEKGLREREVEKATKQLEEISQLEEGVAQFKDIEFSQDDLNSFEEVISTYRDYEIEFNQIKANIEAAKSELNRFQTELASLAEYKDGNLVEDRKTLADALTLHAENFRVVQTKQTSIQMNQYKLNELTNRLLRSEENTEKNKKRNRYSELLNLATDVLQVSNFPRKLILNYAEVVSDHLQEKLEDFNMPYTAKVADNFKIEIYDDEGRKLPSVSGGREIQIGIALHLALHELFSQSFPLLIIDEGTTHLDATNRKAYFDIIKKLKSKDKLQQIIIIDHDPMLEEVVDHLIPLEKIKNG